LTERGMMELEVDFSPLIGAWGGEFLGDGFVYFHVTPFERYSLIFASVFQFGGNVRFLWRISIHFI